MFSILALLITVLSLGVLGPAQAKDVYYDVPVTELKLIEGRLPEPPANFDWRFVERIRAMEPYAEIDGPGEAYLTGPGTDGDPWSLFGVAQNPSQPANHIVIRAPEGKEVKGLLAVAKTDGTGMARLRFFVPASAAKPDAREPFLRARLARFERLSSRDIAGGAWFRHQARLTRIELKLPPDQAPTLRGPNWRSQGELASTYELFSGGRAVSENLQLDRALPQRAPNETPVKVDSIAGITIQEIDWKPLIGNARPSLDPLAGKIPFDQHAVFFPSVRAALAVAAETSRHDTPILRLAQPRSEDAAIIDRYQRQLGLPLGDVAKALPPDLVKSVALTGSDPSFPLGTDVAVLLETPDPAALKQQLLKQIAASARRVKQAKASSGACDGLAYQGFVSPDRAVSSYVAQADGAVVVTNSLDQLKRLAAVRGGKLKALSALPEFTFFRARYARGDADESAFVFLSDATIRRWCGPRWRIADSRRTRARAVLAELQASQMRGLARHAIEPGPIHTDLPIPDAGTIRLTPVGVMSGVYGTLEFMTPVVELPLDEVTKAEAEAYGSWRDGYQRNWNWAFDPIGLRISLGKGKLAGDMTIMPLILNSEYGRFAEISRGASLAPLAGDPHKALAHFILALNRNSPIFRQGEGLAAMMGQKISLGWVGPSIAIYADEDPFWDELTRLKESEIEAFMRKNLDRLPVAVRIESTDALKLAAFLTALRTYVEQTAPGLTRWEALKYRDTGYVRISPARGEGASPAELEKLSIFYTSTGGALTVALSESVMKHAIDRMRDAKADGKAKAGKKAPAPRPWLGSNVALRVDHRILEVGNALGREQYRRQMQAQCWNNLPILNQWRRLFPDLDPVAVHREVWGVTLVCPGGGQYVWNARCRTMESTVYGHPGDPQDGPAAPPVLSEFTTGEFGLTFENNGLRARVELTKETK